MRNQIRRYILWKNYRDEEKYNKNYRKVEAMYRKGYDNKTIMDNMELPRFETLDMIQKIFAIDQMKAERRRCIRV